MLSTGDDGNAKGTVYSALDYPQLPEDMRSHYVWDGAVSNGKLYANEVLKSYEVTFLSDDYIDGWDFDEDYDCYKFVASMLYGSRVEFIASGSEYADSKTITENTTIKLPALPSYKGDSSYDSLLNRDVSAAVSENGARITVHYSAEIKYHSDLAFEAQGVTSQDHTLVTSEKDGLYSPAVSGYTFLGWYLNTESGWRKVETPDFSDMELLEGTLEALWVRDDGIQITKHEKSYNWKKAHDEYVVETAFDNNAIIGAFANDEHNISVLYAYDFQGGNSNYYDFSSSSTCNSTSKFGQPNKTLVVSFKFTVTVGGQAFEYIVTRTASF